MSTARSKIARAVMSIAAAVAGVVATLIPVGYFVLSYQYQSGMLGAEAEIAAQLASRIINANPEMWRFQEHRLEDLLVHRVPSAQGESRRILDLEGRVVVEKADPLRYPILVRSAPLLDSGRAAGRIEIRRSLFPVVVRTGVVGIFGALLGLAIFVTLRILPFRALEGALEGRRQAEQLAEVSRLVSESLDPEEVGQKVANSVRAFLGVRSCTLLRLVPGSADFEVVAVSGELGRLLGRDAVLPAETGAAGVAVRERRPVVTSDVPADPRIAFTPEVRARAEPAMSPAVLAVPLVINDRVIGALSLADGAGRVFEGKEIQLAQAFANQAALAVENTRLFAEQERRQKAAEALVEISRAIGSTLELKQVLKMIAQRAAQAVGAERCTITLRHNGHFVPVMSQFADGHVDALLWAKFKSMGPYGLEEIPANAEAIRTRRPVAVEDVTTTTAIPADWTELFEIRSIVVVPLLLQDDIIGTMNLEQTAGPYAWRQEQLDLAMTIASHAALAVQNARLYERAEERAEKLTVLSRLTQLMTSVADSGEVFRAVARAATTLLGACMARVWGDDPATGFLRVEGSFSVDPRFEPIMTDVTAIPYGKGLIGAVFQSRAPLYVADLHQDARVLNRRLAGQADLRAFAGLPLITGDRVVGVLAIVFGPRRAFTPEEKELMHLLADQAAIAIYNAQLYQEAERRREAAESLAGVERLISQSLDSEEVGRRIVQSVQALLGGKNAVLYRRVPESGDLVAVAVTGNLEGVYEPGLVFPQGTGVCGRAALDGEPVITADLLADPRITLSPDIRRRLRQLESGSVLSAPLVVKSTVIGALSIGDREGRVFSEEEVRLAQAFADQAAVVLENARLYRELQIALQEVEASQQRIVQGERIRALGEMAAGVAHDFNNVLAVVLGRAQMVQAQTADPELQRHFQVIQKAAMDGAQTVRRIQDFTRTRRARPFQPVELDLVIQEVIELTRSRWKDGAEAEGVSYEVRVDAVPLPPVAGDPSELREALTNLLFNALDAMPDGGRVAFTTGVEGERVFCSVADTGIGMTDEVKQRIFDPFFTTKSDKGNGLGLSVVYGIIARHGGEIEVQSRAGQGSVFTIWLPVGRDGLAAPPVAPPAASPRRARILVVDDEPEVAELLRELLTARGHAVAVCTEGEAALADIEEAPFDLVVTDLGMPRVSGWQVASSVKLRNPEIPVILLTGWGDQLDPAEARKKGVDFIAAKPFTFEDIQAAVAAALSPEGGNPRRS